MTMGQYKITSAFLWCAVMMPSLKVGETVAANDFLLSKWRTHIQMFDHDNDGVVRYEDMKTARRIFLTGSNLHGKEKKRAKEDFTHWWVDYIMFGEDEITVEEHVARTNAAYEADKYTFIDGIQKGKTLVFHLTDISHLDDGFISEEEYLLILKAMGHNNVDQIKASFQKYGPIGNKVPVVYMIYYWTHYLITEDEAARDIVVEVLGG